MTATATPKQFRTRPGKPGQPVPQTRFRGSPAAVIADAVSVSPGDGRFEAGLIRGVSLISRGEALGHGMWVDEVLLDQVSELGADADSTGLKSRFTHPSMSADGTGKGLGRIHDVFREGDQVLGNLNLARAAHRSPHGDLAGYVMELADEDPASAGLSIVFDRDLEMEEDFLTAHGGVLKKDEWGPYWDLAEFKSPDPLNTENLPHARLAELFAADFVDDPAANPGGLFDRQPEARQMDRCLEFALGLTEQPPEESPFGIDPTRAQQFLHRWMEQHGVRLTTPTDEDPDMGDQAETPTKTPEEQRAEFLADLNRYTDKFGAENGTAWFNEGLAFEDALDRHCDALAAERDELAARVEELENDLANIKLGESTPVDTAAEETEEEPKTHVEDFCQIPGREPSDN